MKQALVEAHNADEIHGPILQATRGVVFFGTPHRGGHGAKLGDSIVHIVQALTGDVRNDIMEALRKDSFLTGQLDKNFARRAKNLRVVNFMENLRITDLPVARHFGLVRWRADQYYVVIADWSSRSCRRALQPSTGLNHRRYKC